MSSETSPSAGAGGAPLPARAVVAGHGDFAAGIVSAVAQIAGRGDLFVALSNQGRPMPELEELLRAELADPLTRVIFTDLPAGSWTIAARRVLRDRPDVALVTGANLAALLDFACRPDPGAPGAAQHAVDKGRAAIVVIGGVRAD